MTDIDEAYHSGFQEGKTQRDKEELEFLQNMKIALLILGDEELEGMEDAQILVLRRIKLLSSLEDLDVPEEDLK